MKKHSLPQRTDAQQSRQRPQAKNQLDNRPSAAKAKKIQSAINNSPRQIVQRVTADNIEAVLHLVGDTLIPLMGPRETARLQQVSTSMNQRVTGVLSTLNSSLLTSEPLKLGRLNGLMHFRTPTDVVGPGNNPEFNSLPLATEQTPPAARENRYRRLATEEEIKNGVILNLSGKPNKRGDRHKSGDTLGASISNKYYNYHTVGQNANEYIELDEYDRRDIRFSALAFNEAAKTTSDGKLQMVNLGDKNSPVRKAKDLYLAACKVMSKNNPASDGSRALDASQNRYNMHEPDLQFTPVNYAVRATGGSMIGIHPGTERANHMMGQLVNFRHPDAGKLKAGISTLVVLEGDNNYYVYEIDPEKEAESRRQELLKQQYAQEIADATAFLEEHKEDFDASDVVINTSSTKDEVPDAKRQKRK